MSKSLENQKKALIEKADELQIKAAKETFAITFSDRKQVKTVMDHLNKGYTWQTKTAAVLVTLYDQLKIQNKELLKSDVEETVINLRGHELNALYQALLNVEGTGIEAARKFIIMLTHVGETVSVAMQDLASVNTEINDVHTRLAELDAEIVTEQIEAELEDKETVEAGN